ncbi:MAG: hypothetical protein UT84_C0012G0015 [Candidatus Curtissbacteria bacterium GW2011_GWA1_40_16]|uniref:Uncharacterized protein n=1 Tax=Candidatus Curtissbacteria bacterium GW2011_GWA1_40_16 TaxID=1618405 RepID=A0A0G0UJD7_9BACT|nr:MAG: hypothetical protein UT84_C0012G0015 [Candidatus Curtissbacteria bacterium GW2011_GWA1_40_16]
MNQSNNKRIRCGVYLRVSTEEQNKEGHFGLEVQEDKCRAFIESQEAEGYVLDEKHVYKDEISGGSPIEKREGLNKLFEAARQKEFDVLIVYKTDRLARSIRILVNAVHELESLGIKYRSVTEPFDTTTAFGRTAMNLFGTFAEFEKEMIRERTMSGKLKAARGGAWVTGFCPYGYFRNEETKRLEIVPEEAKVIKKIYLWLVNDRCSLGEIERRMNAMGIPSPKYTRITKRETHNYWYKRTIGRILTNEIVMGRLIYRKYKRPFKNLTSLIDPSLLRPDNEWVETKVPPIISKELFNAATQQLIKNREFSKRNQKREYLYAKLIHCGQCNFKMFSGYQPPKKNRPAISGVGKYYHGVYRKVDAIGTTKRCEKCLQYAETRLEPIWECLKAILKNPENMNAPLEKYIYKEENSVEIKERLKEIEVELSFIEKKKEKVQKMYVESDMDEKQYNLYISEYKTETRKLTDESTRLHQRLLSNAEKKERRTAISKVYEQVKNRLDNVSYSDKEKILHMFVERITLFPKENYAQVVFKFPSDSSVAQVDKVISLSPSSDKSFPLVLNIRTMTEKERRVEIIMANPLMYSHKEPVV